MESLPTERYCRRDKQCKLYDPKTGKSQKLGRYHEGDLCRQCEQDNKNTLEDVPEEYRELVHATRVLFEEDVTDEEVIVPTLAFAANFWELQGLGYIRNQFLKAKEGSETWRELQSKSISTFDILCAERVAEDGKTLIVRTKPLCVYLVQDEQRADLIKEIRQPLSDWSPAN